MVVDYLALTGFALAIILFISDFFTEGVFRKRSSIKEGFVSMAAGVSTTYIFLSLFPMLYSGVQVLSNFLFIFVLLGFAAYHIIEKWIYQHAPRDLIVKEIEQEHIITLFLYHFIIGIELVHLSKIDIITGLLFFFPVLLHVIIDAIPHKHVKSVWKRFLSSFSAVLGAGVALVFALPNTINFALLGFIAGLFLFLEIREVIPTKRRGRPIYFVVGMLVYGGFVVASWFILPLV